MPDPVIPFEFRRMVLGDESPLFLLEIAFRTVVIYAYTLVLIRWIGSRSISQLSLVEFLLVIALGSAVGDAMFYPDVPLAHCMAVITIVVLLDKALSQAVVRSERLEDLIEGKSIEVVRDGIIRFRALRHSTFGHDELFEQLRLNDVANLGQVRAAYLETNGMVSVFTSKPGAERPGLSIDPPWDVEEPRKLRAGQAAPAQGLFACARCGTVEKRPAGGRLPDCPHCGGAVWHAVATEPQDA
jgi:uncharacterized membrane protein YcaP (DUF421 family)